MGLAFSEKIPIAVKAAASSMNNIAPIFPSVFFSRSPNSPSPNMPVRIPPRMRPVLKRVDVAPSTMPRSLSALSVQLNCGQRSIARNMQMKASIGAAIPHEPKIFSHKGFPWVTGEHRLNV